MLMRSGGPEALQVLERPAPVVAPGEVRIAVHAAGLNFADTMARAGLYPDAPKPPCVLGYEVAGEVESIGEGVAHSSAVRPNWQLPGPETSYRCRSSKQACTPQSRSLLD